MVGLSNSPLASGKPCLHNSNSISIKSLYSPDSAISRDRVSINSALCCFVVMMRLVRPHEMASASGSSRAPNFKLRHYLSVRCGDIRMPLLTVINRCLEESDTLP
jgi:hypothetical protein